jgi:formate dehydrogenase
MSKKNHRRQKRGRSISPSAMNELQQLIHDLPCQRDLLIEYLHRIQDHFHCLPVEHLHALAKVLDISQVEVFEVASFYHHFDIVKEGELRPAELTIRVCDSVSCCLAGSEKLISNLHALTNDKITIQRVPCVGRCESAPVAVVGTMPVPKATVDKVQQLLSEGKSKDSAPQSAIRFDQYVESEGYQLYKKVLQQKDNNQIIEMLESSGLRGLGGAGFPVGKKWRIVSEQQAPRLMAVNIDEGEPGTFKDRYYLERDVHRFIEGMLIAAHVVGIAEIYIYLRDEYAGIRELLTQELAVLRSKLKQDLPLIHLRRGAGAYICGEESAMIESIEGKRGMPRQRPPFVAQQGLFNRPTLEHNMESLYWVRDIVEKGSEWFVSKGRNGRTGLRSFSVSGRVKNPGVYLAPAGITLLELIAEYCDGMQQGHTLYGYLPGGASGGILPARLANIPLDFDTLQEYGCFIGSAAIIVLSEADSVRDVSLNIMKFFQHESCGQCTPCRVGTSVAVELLQQKQWSIDHIHDLSKVMQDASICGLGQAAPNPMECVIKYFPDEIEPKV